MSKKQNNMFAAAVQRQEEQKEIEAAVTAGTNSKPNKMIGKKRGAGATTITLTISSEDKLKVKEYAVHHNTTVSDLLHQWINDLCI